MDESAFWVGPKDAPHRFRLTHLLGSGGEGEVWRALRQDDGHEVAIKINSSPAASAGEQDHLQRLVRSRIKGLVQVHEVFTGAERHRIDDRLEEDSTHSYVVMSYVQGITLRTWLDEHPDAPARERLKILRGVASALTRLHRGGGGRDPLTHGDVKPSNVIITRDGRPVLVDLGLLRSVGSGPVSGHTAAYSSPELRNPDGHPSPRADTFSFAVTAMETLTTLTPPLDGAGELDLDATRARIASAPALRLRPVLRRQLLASLTVDPEQRPGTPARVFAGRGAAVVASALTALLIAGSGTAMALQSNATTPVADPSPRPSATTGSEQVLGPSTAPDPTPSPTSTPTPSASATPTAVVQRLTGTALRGAFLGGTFPEFRSFSRCGSVSNVLAPPTGDRRAWGGEDFTLTLKSDRDAEILTITAEPTSVPGPSHLIQTIDVNCDIVDAPNPPTVCPGPTGPKAPPYRTETRYNANLDAGTLAEAPTRDSRPFGVLGDKCAPPSVLNLVTQQCQGNYDYRLVVEYRLPSEPNRVYTQRFGPLRLQGAMNNGTFTTSLAGIAKHVTRGFSAAPEGCAGRRSVPYDQIQRETAELIVQAVRKQWNATPGITRGEAVALVATILNSTVDYNASKITRLCSQADREPGWRGTCGTPDAATGEASTMRVRPGPALWWPHPSP